MYNVDFDRLVRLNLPEWKRKPIMLGFIYTLIKGCKDIHVQLMSLRNNTSRFLNFNGQTIYLEHILNEEFDPNGWGVYIDNVIDRSFTFIYNKSEGRDPFYIYNKSEGKPPRYIYNKIEYLSTVDFIVYVPLAVVFDIDQMTALVNKYRYASRTFQIITY